MKSERQTYDKERIYSVLLLVWKNPILISIFATSTGIMLENMKSIPILIIVSTLYFSCSFLKNANTTKSLTTGSIRFQQYTMITPEGKKSIRIIADSMAKASGLPIESFEGMYDVLGNSITQINIEFTSDSIWRFEKAENTSLKKIFVNRKEGTIMNFTKDAVPKVTFVDTMPAIDMLIDTLMEYKEAQKTILGYKCYKVVLKKKVKDVSSIPFDFGYSVTELFVTEKINLPPYALFYFQQGLQFFPLEIHRYMSNAPGIIEIYEAKEIIRSK